MSDQTKNLYATRVLTAVAGCERSTFAKWRDRNGLLPREAAGWHFWSFADICAARFVVVLTEHGLSAYQACLVAENLICFHSLTTWGSPAELVCFVIFKRDGDIDFKKCRAERLIQFLEEDAVEVLTIINVAKVIEYCRERLDDFAFQSNEERLFPCAVVEDGEERTEYLPMQHRLAIKNAPDAE